MPVTLSSLCVLSVELSIFIGILMNLCNPAAKPEMEVTEKILAKVSRLCHLSSHSRGFLSSLQIFKSIGPSIWISFFLGGGGTWGAYGQDTIL
jgi:hypothetical protein